MSNELSQELPLTDHLKMKVKSIYQGVEINPFKLTPSMKVSDKLQKINEQILIMFSFENMIKERKEDEAMWNDKKEQIAEIAKALS